MIGPTASGLSALAAPPQADLEVIKTADAIGTVHLGDQVTYTIDVTNNGPAEATGVAVTDALPAQVTYVSDTCSGSYEGGTHTWTWTLGALANGASATCDLVVETVPGNGDPFDNTAAVAGTEPDLTPGNDASTASVAASDAVPGMRT